MKNTVTCKTQLLEEYIDMKNTVTWKMQC
jgi:hypothetical protein